MINALRISLVASLVTGLVTGLAGCGPETAPPNPLAAPAVEALAQASAAGESDVATLLAEDALVIDGERFGREEGAAALATAALTLRSAVDSHHDVLRALVTRGDDERVLFGRLDDDGLFVLVVLTAAPADGTGGGGDVVNAYEGAWNDSDAAARTALLETSWAEEGRYVDPTADVAGRAALAAHITEFRDGLPGAAVTSTSDVVEQAGMVHFRWLTTGLAGAVNVEGMDVGLVGDDGLLELIAGFFGPLESTLE